MTDHSDLPSARIADPDVRASGATRARWIWLLELAAILAIFLIRLLTDR